MQKATKSRKTSSGKNEKTQAKGSSQPTNMQMGEEMEKLFTDTLKDIYWAEKALTKALPILAKASTTTELSQAFEEHLTQTEEHIRRLEQVFELMGEKAQANKCDAMEGLQKEAEKVIEETPEGSLTRDVGLIIAAQKVEHYEIATYGGLTTLANTFGMTEVAELLGRTLEEEKETDENLTYIAENNVNFPAGIEDEASPSRKAGTSRSTMEEEEDEEA